MIHLFCPTFLLLFFKEVQNVYFFYCEQGGLGRIVGRYVFFGGGIIVFSSFFAGLKREFSGYNAAKLVKDILAGLTVCAVALPLALAFGVSSGASAAAALLRPSSPVS